ncbi:unnamed protein product [Calypogeia fissa]
MAPWFMDQKFVYTFRWESHFDVRLETYTMLPVWIKIHFRSIILEKCRKQVAGALGKVLYYVQGDELSSFPHDRACILWDTTRPVPKSVKICLTNDLAIWQPVNFRNIPYHCYKCGRRGHIARDCGKESEPIAPTPAPPPLSPLVVPRPGEDDTNPAGDLAGDSIPQVAPDSSPRMNDDTHMHAEYADEPAEEEETDERDQLAADSRDVDVHEPESAGPGTELVDAGHLEAPSIRIEDPPRTPLHAATQTPPTPLPTPGITPMITDSDGDLSEYEEHFSQNLINGDKARKLATRTPDAAAPTADKTGKKQKKQLQFNLQEDAPCDDGAAAVPAAPASGGSRKGASSLKPKPSEPSADNGSGNSRRPEQRRGKAGQSSPPPGT